MSDSRFNQSASPPLGVSSYMDASASSHRYSLRPFDPITFSMTNDPCDQSSVTDGAPLGLAGVLGISQSQRKKSKNKSAGHKGKRHSILSATGISLSGLNPSSNNNNNIPTIVPRHAHQSSYPSAKSNSPINMDAYDLSMSPQQQQMLRNGETIDASIDVSNMTTRNVIIRKEASGYGITISGDNPVFIQTVKLNSAAYNAGARAGDRIIKINGTLVTKLDHTAVVKMLKDCDSYVGLTLASPVYPLGGGVAVGANVVGTTSPGASPVPPAMSIVSQPSSPPISYQAHAHHPSTHYHSQLSNYSLSETSLGNAQITHPAPATEQTQLIFLDTQINMLQKMIEQQKTELEALRNSGSGLRSEMEKKEKVIDNLNRKLDENRAARKLAAAISASTVSARSQMLTLDSDFEEDEDEDEDCVVTTTGVCRDDSKTGASFDQDLTSSTAKLFPGHSKRGSSSRSKRDSKQLAERLTLDNIVVNSLRLARYLIQSNRPPHALLFYTIARHVFAGMVQSLLTSGNSMAARSIIQRWAYQIVATWAMRQSPLYFCEYSPECFAAFDRTLSSFVSSSMTSMATLVTNLFEPFLESAREIVQDQLNEFKAASVGRKEWLGTSFREDLQASIEMLLGGGGSSGVGGMNSSPINFTGLFGKVEIRDIDAALDLVIAHAQSNNVSTIAITSSLLTIAHFQYEVNSRHVLLADSNCTTSLFNPALLTAVSSFPSASSLNPVLKLSDSSSSNSKKSAHKRMSSIPGSTSSVRSSSIFETSEKNANKNAIQEAGHTFLSVIEMTRVLDCNGCMLPLWGEYSQRCSRCLLTTHVWCRKAAAATSLCSSTTPDVSTSSALSTGGRKSRSGASKDKKNSVLGMFGITGGVFQKQNGDQNNNNNHLSKSSTSFDSSSESSCSSTDDSDDESSAAVVSPGADDPKARLMNNSHIQSNKNFNDNRSSTIAISPLLIHQAQAANAAAQANQAPVNRSGSFNQRKKSKSSAGALNSRKRSDPALTSRAVVNTSTTFGSISPSNTETISTTVKKLTSAQSSGALVSYNNNERRADNAKPMTASDSSLASKSSMPLSLLPASVHSETTEAQGESNNISGDAFQAKKDETLARALSFGAADSMEDSKSSAPVLEDNELLSNENSSIPAPPPPPPPSWRHRGTSAGELGIVSGPPPLPPRPISEKRRAILQEIVDTEWTHFDTLKYTRNVYQKTLKDLRKDNPFNKEEMRTIFGNLRRLKSIHRQVHKRLKAAHDMSHAKGGSDPASVVSPCLMEETLEDIFCGELGQTMQGEVSDFCINHKAGLEIWNAKKKDPRLKYLQDTELKKKEMPNCQFSKHQLQDLLSAGFQRPLRYPLLLERLLKETTKDTKAYKHIEAALEQSKLIAQHINDIVDRAEQKARLTEILKKTDESSYRIPGLLDAVGTKQELIHQGPLQLRLSKNKSVEILLVLTDQLLLMLTKESKSSDSSKDERYQLKAQNHPINKKPLKPDIKMDDLLIRPVATDSNAFFVLSKNQDLMYEFAASSPADRQKWITMITNATDAYNKRMGNPSANSSLQRSYTTVGVQPSKSIDLTAAAAAASKSESIASVADIQRRPLPSPPAATLDAKTEAEDTPEESGQEKQVPNSGGGGGPTRYVGVIKNVQPTPLVPFSSVTVSNETAGVHRATIQELTGEQQENLRNYLNEQHQSEAVKNFAADVKGDVNNLLMICDIAQYDANNDVRDLKCRLAYELFKKAMSIVSPLTAEEGGETGASLRADFDQLHGQIDLFMKKIVQPKDVATTDSGIANDNNPDEGETNSRSRSQRSLRSDSNVSKKSELDDIECLFEELVDQQLNEFENTTIQNCDEEQTKDKERRSSSVLPSFVDIPEEPIYDDPEVDDSQTSRPLFSEIVASTLPNQESQVLETILPAATTTEPLDLEAENLSSLSSATTSSTIVAKTETYMI